MTNALHLDEVSKKMKDIDIAILSTHAEGGHIANRPMSNNGDVRYDGTSYFFSYERAHCIAQIEQNAKVALGYSTEGGMLSSAVYIAVEGQAQLIRDKAEFKRHWTTDLDRWFEKGVDTPDLVLISVRAERIKLWERNDERELVL